MVRELSWYYVLLDFLGVEGLTEEIRDAKKKKKTKLFFLCLVKNWMYRYVVYILLLLSRNIDVYKSAESSCNLTFFCYANIITTMGKDWHKRVSGRYP